MPLSVLATLIIMTLIVVVAQCYCATTRWRVKLLVSVTGKKKSEILAGFFGRLMIVVSIILLAASWWLVNHYCAQHDYKMAVIYAIGMPIFSWIAICVPIVDAQDLHCEFNRFLDKYIKACGWVKGWRRHDGKWVYIDERLSRDNYPWILANMIIGGIWQFTAPLESGINIGLLITTKPETEPAIFYELITLISHRFNELLLEPDQNMRKIDEELNNDVRFSPHVNCVTHQTYP